MRGMVTLGELQALVDNDIRLGVTDCAPFPELAGLIKDRVRAGLHGGLKFTYGAAEVAADPGASFPWGHSIVVAAVPYLVDGDGIDGDRLDGERSVARFADGDRYARLRETLDALAGALTVHAHRAEQVFDDDRLVDRAVAVRAGVAWAGVSTMALMPGHGPWFLIGSVVTDAVLEPGEPMVRTCGTCTACMPACPTEAIIAPGVLDASRCLAAVLQRGGSIPTDLREAVADRIYGCDSCLTACPPGQPVLTRVAGGGGDLDPSTVLAMSDEELDAVTPHWYVPKRSMRFVRRNALVAMGNRAAREEFALLCGYLGHPDAMLRGHAAWALGQQDHELAGGVLKAALADEPDAQVREEIASALEKYWVLGR